MKQFRKRIFVILELKSSDSLIAKIFDVSIVTLILISVASVILETDEGIYSSYQSVFIFLEYLTVIVFSIEYLLRLWTCVEDGRYGRPVLGRLRYAATPLAIVDLLAIMPFYMPLIMPVDLRFLRLFRLIRLFKLTRYSRSFNTIGAVLKAKKDELIITLSAALVLLIACSSLIYYAERSAQPQVFSSIPASMWWGTATLTTIGYGDMKPVTTSGKLLASIVSILGIGMFALPAGILGSGFVEEMHKRRAETKSEEAHMVCPHCGGELEKWESGPFNAEANDVAIESIEIAHDGLIIEQESPNPPLIDKNPH